MTGKGDDARPKRISDEEFAENWKRIFHRERDRRLRLEADKELQDSPLGQVDDDDEAR